ncbi:MAG: FKBP-type peptidyl-prolyl cis-trans isomerase [Sedimentisphaerales bacterium]|nr:FKBP-type peptidyl-prolyl cis-trans isomerase [Sedimentisphaerales bacterium]
MTLAKQGDHIRVHYKILLEDGSLFDSTFPREPVQFQIGQNKLHLAFEKAFIGMDIGESKTITLSVDQAFGPHLPEKVVEVNRDRIAPDVELHKGQRLKMMGCSRRAIMVKVVDFSESSVTLDTNHPLAGKNLTLELTLMAIL